MSKVRVSLTAVCLAVVTVGCTQNPLSQSVARTPYGRYQALRGGEPPMEKPDSFGNLRPALRERLEPMERP